MDITRKLASVKRIDAITPIEGAEGIVFKRIDGDFSFKAISNKFLLKEAA